MQIIKRSTRTHIAIEEHKYRQGAYRKQCQTHFIQKRKTLVSYAIRYLKS